MEINKITCLTDFESALKNDGLVVVKAAASWCNPCKMLTKTIESMDTIEGVHYFEFDVDEDNLSVLTERYGIMSLPTQLFFKNGEEVHKVVGALPKDKLKEEINSCL